MDSWALKFHWTIFERCAKPVRNESGHSSIGRVQFLERSAKRVRYGSGWSSIIAAPGGCQLKNRLGAIWNVQPNVWDTGLAEVPSLQHRVVVSSRIGRVQFWNIQPNVWDTGLAEVPSLQHRVVVSSIIGQIQFSNFGWSPIIAAPADFELIWSCLTLF